MSRGYGIWQRAILAAIERSDKLVPLGGSTRSEQVSILRAAKSLERAGKCEIIRRWNEGHTVVIPLVCRPGLIIDGRPARELSVERVPHGTGTAFRDSIRQIADELSKEDGPAGCSRSQVWRMSKMQISKEQE
jgi:hypothetical protein